VYKQTIGTPELDVDGDERPKFDLAGFVKKNELRACSNSFPFSFY
jgi:hypothetical protein